MNARATSLFAPPLTSADTGAQGGQRLCCFHCGLDVDFDTHLAVEVDGQQQPMCCVGCQSVAQTIIAAGLIDFYRHRMDYSDKLDPRTVLPNAIVSESPRAASTAGAATTPSELTLYVSGLRCAACVWLVERSLGCLPGVNHVAVNLTTQSAYLRYHSAAVTTSDIIHALARVGLEAEPAEYEARLNARKHERRTQMLELGVAALCMMQVMMLVVPIYLADAVELSADAKQLMGWTAWLLTLPVLLFSAQPIFVSAFRSVLFSARSGTLGMDVPVALALTLTFIASTLALLTQSGQHYFDAITMFVFLLLAARWLESSLRRRTAESIDRLANARPLTAERLVDYPAGEAASTIRADRLVLGDVISIRPGECVPADAIVLRGTSEIDEALMTGESRPVTRSIGEALLGGTVNIHSPLIARVTAVGEHTLLSRLGKMVESSLMYRPPLQGIADRAARWIAPVTLLLAAAAAILWWGHDPSRAGEIAIAVLVVTCPCAFALAAPAALAAALSRMTSDGVLITRGHLIETMATATDVVFDKTGTLSTGVMRVAVVHCGVGQEAPALRIAVAMERGAAHPVAKALIAHADAHAAEHFAGGSAAAKFPVASALEMIVGKGVEACVEGRSYRLGRPDFAVPPAMRAAMSTIVLPLDQSPIVLCSVDDLQPRVFAVFCMSDPLRADAAACIHRLQARGLRVHVLSGDSEDVVSTCARQLDIPPGQVLATQTPAQKQAYVQALVQSGARVVAVGDGVNDAPMLAAASGSIGLVHGATLTRLSADAVLAANRGRLLDALADAFDTARHSQRVVRQNLFWALGYNVVAVPLAFAGLVTPLIAAIGMALSSLIVVLNASRLRLQSRHAISSATG